MKKKLDKKIIHISNSWSFNKNVSDNFDLHVKQSIPFYHEIINAIASLSEFFMKENSVIYDLGCSTGNIISSLSKLNLSHSIEIYGVDREEHMLKIAETKLKKLKVKKNIKISFIKKDVLKLSLKQNNLTICSLLFPFFCANQQEINDITITCDKNDFVAATPTSLPQFK